MPRDKKPGGGNPLILGRNATRFPPFRARWPWIGGDLQTLRNTLHHRAPDFAPYPAQRLLLPMRDGSGDCLYALLNLPTHDQHKPLVVLVHGLTGSEDSRNIMTSAAYHLSRGYPVMRLNLRNAGPGRGKCRGHYHAGRSSDIRDALAELPPGLSSRGIFLIGVSLGGNAVLKFLGEQRGTENVRAAASVCAPIDLKMAQMRIAAPRNAIYERHLLASMRSDARLFGIDDIENVLANVRSVYDFDDLIVAPNNGYANAEDYYRRSSAAQFLDSITVPTLLVHPRNDPWVPARMYLERTWKPDGPLTLLMPPGGGHVGFHAADDRQPWHDRCIGMFFATA
jgi:predicted alpha/beta-fold hydrolase